MKLSFYPRLALYVVGVFMVVIVACFYVTNLLQQRTQEEAEQRLHNGLAEHLVTQQSRAK